MAWNIITQEEMWSSKQVGSVMWSGTLVETNNATEKVQRLTIHFDAKKKYQLILTSEMFESSNMEYRHWWNCVHEVCLDMADDGR